MLSLIDCLEFCELDVDEIEAIAAELGCEMLKTPDGIDGLRCILRDNIDHASDLGQCERAERFTSVYRHFCATHPA